MKLLSRICSEVVKSELEFIQVHFFLQMYLKNLQFEEVANLHTFSRLPAIAEATFYFRGQIDDTHTHQQQ